MFTIPFRRRELQFRLRRFLYKERVGTVALKHFFNPNIEYCSINIEEKVLKTRAKTLYNLHIGLVKPSHEFSIVMQLNQLPKTITDSVEESKRPCMEWDPGSLGPNFPLLINIRANPRFLTREPEAHPFIKTPKNLQRLYI